MAMLVLVAGCGGGAPPATTYETRRATPGAGVPSLPAGDVLVGADGRSVTVACSRVTLGIEAIGSAVVRLRYRGSAAPAGRASYAVIDRPDPAARPSFEITPDTVRARTDDLVVEVARRDCRLRAASADGTVLVEDPEGGGYFEGKDLGRGVVRAAAPGERFYGLGEKAGALDKRGRTLTFWNADAYDPREGPLYESIPFFIGLRGGVAYGVLLDDTHRLRFDMAAGDPSRYVLATAGDEVDQYLVAGPALRDVVARYTRLTGRMPLPPRWALGYHQSRWGYWPDSQVLSIAGELRRRNLPADALWLDIQHLDGFRSFTWDPRGFPDPAGLVARLSAMGFKTVVIVDPGIKVDRRYDVYAEGIAGAHFLARNGAPYVGRVWPGDACFPDFSAPATRAFWGALVPREIGLGVQGLWIDMNEPSDFVAGTEGTVPGDVPCAGDGTPGTMAELHQVYGLNEARATYEGMRAAAPSRRPFVLTRAGFAGVGRYAAVWTGDAPSTWATLRETLPLLLGLGLSGIAFCGSDVGGFTGGASPELYARWMELGAVSPFFRGHLVHGVPGQEPWRLGPEVEDASRAVMTERYRLLPYLYSLFREAAQTGAPVLRPLVFEFQDDPGSAAVDDEAMLGPSLLVAPVLAPRASHRPVYLPPGRWIEERSGAVHEGPSTVSACAPLDTLPTYVREGAVVPRFDPVAFSDEKPSATLFLDAYPGPAQSRFVLYEDDGASFAYEEGRSAETTYTLQRLSTGARLVASARQGAFAPPPRALQVRVRGVDHGAHAVRLSGRPLPAFADRAALAAAGEGYWYDAGDRSLVVVFPDREGFTLEMEYGERPEPGPRVAPAGAG
jgi:alpha-glucosidase